MRQAVRDAFYDFNSPMEGEVPWLYQDVKGLVSIGVGILCDPIQLAMNLPMVHLDGSPASRADIAVEWKRIKELPPDVKGRTAAQLGHLYAKPHTRLRLTKDGLRSTLGGKLHQNDLYLVNRFRCTTHDDCKANEALGRACTFAFEQWPADAQLATHSLAWACGPAFRFPKCEAALRRLDFATAAVESFMPEEKTISGLRPRNKANRMLFRNAAIVQTTDGLDPSVLYYPRDLWETSDTQPPPPPDFEIVTRLPGSIAEDPPDDAA